MIPILNILKTIKAVCKMFANNRVFLFFLHIKHEKGIFLGNLLYKNRRGLYVPFLAGIANSLFDLLFENMLTFIIWVIHQTRGRFSNFFLTNDKNTPKR